MRLIGLGSVCNFTLSVYSFSKNKGKLVIEKRSARKFFRTAYCIGGISRFIGVFEHNFITNGINNNIICSQSAVQIGNCHNYTVCGFIHSNTLAVFRGFNNIVIIIANYFELQVAIEGYSFGSVVRAVENGCAVLQLNFKGKVIAGVHCSAGKLLADEIYFKLCINRVINVGEGCFNRSSGIGGLL